MKNRHCEGQHDRKPQLVDYRELIGTANWRRSAQFKPSLPIALLGKPADYVTPGTRREPLPANAASWAFAS